MNEDAHLEASYEERHDPVREEKADDPYDDDSLESCSWCSDLVPDVDLQTAKDGARVCPNCADANPDDMPPSYDCDDY